MKIRELIDDIRKQNLVLPEFQREYVWTKEQAKQLMVSLLKQYPVGGALFWKTDNPPELKNVDTLPEKLGTIEVILDGQQRLTTLYMLVTGNIPPYYSQKDITTDVSDLYFHMGEQDFQYYQSLRMSGNPLWRRVVDCFVGTEQINVFTIAQEQTEDQNEAFQLAQLYNDNLTKLRQIVEMDLPVQMVPPHAQIEDAIDIFDRVNSQGTKLSDAELALTHITGKWPQARRVMKEKIAVLNQRYFYFDLTFMTRALTGIVTRRALFEHIHKSKREALEQGWSQLSDILDYLVQILPTRAYIHSTEDVNTNNAFIPLIVYLSLHDNQFPNEQSIKQALHWLYAALMWSRYTAQTDQRLEHDLSLVSRHESPWGIMTKQIVDQRGRLDVKASDLEGRGVQHPLFRMAYIVAKAQGAIDWFTGTPLGTVKDGAYYVHRYYIFPPRLLYKSQFDSGNHLHRKIVNEIANRAFATTKDNPENLPDVYFPQVLERYPDALDKQMIPVQPELWKMERVEEFFATRRVLIARQINQYMDALLAKMDETTEQSISDLIAIGENATIEFKSTLEWDVRQERQNKGLVKMVIKTIAGFLNSQGGTLVIGVEDDGAIFGLEKDYRVQGSKGATREQARDKFQLKLMQKFADYIGAEFSRFIKLRFEEIEGKDVCAVDVENATEPIFAYNQEFYVRIGSMTKLFGAEEANQYIRMTWD